MKPTFRQRLQYHFDNLMSRGTPALIGMLFVLTLAVVFIAGAVIAAGAAHIGQEALTVVIHRGRKAQLDQARNCGEVAENVERPHVQCSFAFTGMVMELIERNYHVIAFFFLACGRIILYDHPNWGLR